MNILSAGDRALLVEFADQSEAMSHYRALAADPLPSVIDLVPAARTVLVQHDGNREGVTAWIRRTTPLAASPEESGPSVVIEVIYDGPDLDEVAQLTGLSPSEVIAAHTGTSWTVAFGGFAPGFGYLVDSSHTEAERPLNVPRRTESRTRVPAGAVGLAGEFSGIYPRSSPGGWQLIGRTDAPLWDADRDPPALLRPGVTVTFEQRSP